jgi:protein-tyrosine phosphatase
VTALERAPRLIAIGLTVLLAGCATPQPPSPTALAPASAVAVATSSPSAALRIGSVSNFRDVAGDGLALPGGRTMRTGVVYRSAKLAGISKADKALLVAAGLTGVLDLRTPAVAKASPDPRISGAKYHLINLFAVNKTPKPKLRSVAAARAHMRGINVGFVAKSAQRARVARTLRLIAGASGPVVVHCTEGKDRTGWISAILQLSVGATTDQVHAEYLKSNDYRATIIAARYRATKARSGLKAAQIERAQLKVDVTYLDAGLKELKRRYGSIDGYLTRGLKLDATTIAKLRARLVS